MEVVGSRTPDTDARIGGRGGSEAVPGLGEPGAVQAGRPGVSNAVGRGESQRGVQFVAESLRRYGKHILEPGIVAENLQNAL